MARRTTQKQSAPSSGSKRTGSSRGTKATTSTTKDAKKRSSTSGPSMRNFRQTIGLLMAIAAAILPYALIVLGSAEMMTSNFIGIGAVAIAVVASSVLLQRSRRRVLPADEPETLANAYRASVFIRLAVSEFPGLVGLVAAIATRDAGPLLAGWLTMLVGFAFTWPGTADIARAQALLDAAGVRANLFEALDLDG